jgi:hypothetical protein
MVIAGSTGPSSAALTATGTAAGHHRVSSSEPPRKPRIPTDVPKPRTAA